MLEILLFPILAMIFAVTGVVIGSNFDTGSRSEGNIRNDMPSTIGGILGMIFGITLAYYHLI